MKIITLTLLTAALSACVSSPQNGGLPREDTFASAMASGLLDYAVGGGSDTFAETMAAEALGYAVSREGSANRAATAITTQLTGLRDDSNY